MLPAGLSASLEELEVGEGEGAREEHGSMRALLQPRVPLPPWVAALAGVSGLAGHPRT